MCGVIVVVAGRSGLLVMNVMPIFMIILFINPQFIGSRKTHRKIILHRIDLQEDRGVLCIEIQKERRTHLANNYGPEGLW